jgi:HD-like signal output (HDOD) protein
MIDLDVLARDAARLDPMPASVVRLASLVGAGDPPFDEIIELVQFDQAMTASLLRTANSSWSASRSEVATVKDAVIRLGAGPVLSLAIAAHVQVQMTRAVPELGLGEQDLWNHSVAAMLAAEMLGRAAPHRPPAETATAALLHDVGKLIMARHLDAADRDALVVAEAAGRTRMQAERDVLGVTHAELGGLIAQSWGLPETLARGIRLHHEPDPRDGAIACAVHLADLVAKAVASDGAEAPGPRVDFALSQLGLTKAALAETTRLVRERLVEVQNRLPGAAL